MINYRKVCQNLTNAFSINADLCPKYTIIPNDDIPEKKINDDHEIKNKVQANYDRWITTNNLAIPLICKGCFEIDNFTGNELLRVFCDIISKKKQNGAYFYEPGNVIYLSRNQSYCAAVRFTKSKPVITTQTPAAVTENNVTIKYEHLYSALFNDNRCEFHWRNPDKFPITYSQRHVVEIRKAAKEMFPLFLSTKVASANMFPYGFHFLSVLVFIAYKISSRGNPCYRPEALDLDIPFAACLKFAFDNSFTGKVSALTGELTVKSKEMLWKERAKNTANVAEELIKRYV